MKVKKREENGVTKFTNELSELWGDRKRIAQLGLENIPNFLTIARFIITFVVMYLILTHQPLSSIITLFVIGALTDFFDGKLARRYDWETEFGRKADIIADRFLWVGTVIAFVITFGNDGLLGGIIGLQLLMIMSREIISAPFVLISFFSGTTLPHARYVAKVTTFLQGFALPALILSSVYPFMTYFSFPLSCLCLFTGFISALYYLKDIHAPSMMKAKK